MGYTCICRRLCPATREDYKGTDTLVTPITLIACVALSTLESVTFAQQRSNSWTNSTDNMKQHLHTEQKKKKIRVMSTWWTFIITFFMERNPAEMFACVLFLSAVIVREIEAGNKSVFFLKWNPSWGSKAKWLTLTHLSDSITVELYQLAAKFCLRMQILEFVQR